MRNRVLLAAGTLALVPTLLFAQQRPAQPPAQRPAQPPAQRPPAAQPAQRPAAAPVRAVTGDHREGTWELTASAGVVATDQQFNVKQIAPGGALRVGYNINQMLNISIGSGVGFPSVKTGSGSVTLVQPFAAITWTPDINKKTSPFITVGAGGTYARYSNGGFSTHITAE